MNYYEVFLEVIEKIKVNENVCALLLIGKTSKVVESEFNSLNDIDILVVTEENVSFQRQVEDINGVPFDISYISIYDLITQVEAKSQIWVNIIIASKIYYTRNELIFGIIDRVKDIYYIGTSKLKDEDIKLIRFNLTQKYYDVLKQKGDVIVSGFLMSKLFDKAIQDYYRLNSIWYPREKYIFDNLEVLDSQLCKMSKDFIYECSGKRKAEILNNILIYILEPFGGLLDKWPKGLFDVTL